MDDWKSVRAASNDCASSQQEYQRLGRCAETVHTRYEKLCSPLSFNMLGRMFRDEFNLGWRWSNREIRQDFGVFSDQAVNKLTLQ